jgi:hypothetical protein
LYPSYSQREKGPKNGPFFTPAADAATSQGRREGGRSTFNFQYSTLKELNFSNRLKNSPGEGPGPEVSAIFEEIRGPRALTRRSLIISTADSKGE